MNIIGLCGTSGSGKSTVSSIFQEQGITVLDCDKIYHALINSPSDCLEAICGRFGKELVSDGVLNRKALKDIVFSDPKALTDLNEIAHKFIKIELKSRLDALLKENTRACIIDAPLLFEANLDAWCDAVCVVVCDTKTQIKRICARDGLTENEAQIRISNQTSQDVLMKNADFIIQNNGNITELTNKCLELIPLLMKER